MSEQTTGTITITVPYITETSGFREPRPCSGAMADGRRFVGAVRDERSVLIAEADIGKAVLAAWPGEAPTGDKKRRARFYLDTEFNETPGVLDLKIAGEARLTRAEIRDRIGAFVGDLTPEFWAYFADYDWVLFCWLFGAMVDLPKGWPMFCLDLKQVMHERGLTKANLPAQPDDSHHALADARWLREAHEVVRGYVASKGRQAVAPTGERGKRLAEIAARVDGVPAGVWSWEEGRDARWTLYVNRGEPIDPEMPRGFCNMQHGANILRGDAETFDRNGEALRGFVVGARPDLLWLLAEVTAADAALAAAGIHDDGRPLAERIAALAKERDGFASTIDPVAQAAVDLGSSLSCSRLLTLRVKFTDEQAAAEVTPEQANAYLAARGWTLRETAEPWHVWRRPTIVINRDDEDEMVVPVHANWRDYGKVMARLINECADDESRSALAVWVDMTAKP